jgi:hypothetical protein
MIGSVGVILQRTPEQVDSDAVVNIAVASIVVGGVLLLVVGAAAVSRIQRRWKKRK